MSKSLIIVESPTKARTLGRFLGEDFQIEASMGHIRDLPKSKIGVEVEKNFEPTYIIPTDKRKTVEHLKDLTAKAANIILATDPDREGEAIAWHLSEIIREQKKDGKDFQRIVFHEITKEAVEQALTSPRSIDQALVDAQQARRVLDRLVGYKLSPILWFKVKKGLSAGRVQSVAVRLIVDREREIDVFKPVEYWSIDALFKKGKDEFEAALTEKDGKKLSINNQKDAAEVVKGLEGAEYKVNNVTQKELKKSSYPPFTTSTLTQTAANRLRFTSKKTMKLAQDLYEEGLITYHRTDSVNLAQIALTQTRKYVEKNIGKEYLPDKARIFKTTSKSAQEAHEAIRPTQADKVPDSLKNDLDRDHLRLYELIWQRMVASQMREAIYDQIALDIKGNAYTFRANGAMIKFAGWLKIYGREEGDQLDERFVPLLKIGDSVDLKALRPNQHFTEPPPRYTEASLIKALEEKGIGRPSTYAPIISTIQDRNYVELLERKFKPTPLGTAVTDFLVKNFAQEVDYQFTAEMEDKLDQVAEGKEKWQEMIRAFWQPFEKHLEVVAEKAARVKVEAETVDEMCPEGHQLVIRYGRFGKFLACEKFPDHKFTKTFEEKVDALCPESGDPVVIKRTKRGRPFFGCSGYPKCKWMSWTKPETTPPVDEVTAPAAEA
ncbi:MAG: type I DNA topoisomerase [bacterium]|nr:type I DNA topoisomerase [bacterium]